MGPFEQGMIAGSVVLLAITGFVFLIRLNDFKIRGSGGNKVKFSGRFPDVYRIRMNQFLESEVQEQNWTIRGAFKDRRFIRLKFSGNLHPHTRQRIRNYMMSLLHP